MEGNKHICPCFVTEDQMDSAFEICRGECALHRQKAIQQIRDVQKTASDIAAEEAETILEKALKPLKDDILELKIAHQNSEKEHKDFYRNVIYVLFGMLGTIAVGFISMMWTTGGI